jgi:hypothetical protein
MRTCVSWSQEKNLVEVKEAQSVIANVNQIYRDTHSLIERCRGKKKACSLSPATLVQCECNVVYGGSQHLLCGDERLKSIPG